MVHEPKSSPANLRRGWLATKNPVQLGVLLRFEPWTLSLVCFWSSEVYFSSPSPDHCTKLVIRTG